MFAQSVENGTSYLCTVVLAARKIHFFKSFVFIFKVGFFVKCQLSRILLLWRNKSIFTSGKVHVSCIYVHIFEKYICMDMDTVISIKIYNINKHL